MIIKGSGPLLTPFAPFINNKCLRIAWLTLQALLLNMIFLKYGMLFLQQMYDIQEVYKNSRIIRDDYL